MNESARRTGFSLPLTLVLLATAATAGCLNPGEPPTTATVYLLRTCRLPGGDQELPCAYSLGTPGDSMRAYGGSLTISSDGTWALLHFSSERQQGLWGVSFPLTLGGTWRLAGSSSGRDSLVLQDSSAGGGANWAIRYDAIRLDLNDYWTYYR